MTKERLCGACGRIIPVGGSRDCGLDHALLEHCAKHGPHAPGECSRCDALAEARSIVATTYIPPAPPSSNERAALREAEHALACIAAVTPEDTDVGRYARNYFRRQSKAPLLREPPHCPSCGCGLAVEPSATLVGAPCPTCQGTGVIRPRTVPDGPTTCLGIIQTGECSCGLGTGHAVKSGEQRIAVETPQSRKLFDMADNLIREMRKHDMWGMRSEYDNWTLRITRNDPAQPKAGEQT